MGYPQPLHDALGIDYLLLMLDEGAHLLGPACSTPIRQRTRARANACPPELRLQPEAIASLEEPR